MDNSNSIPIIEFFAPSKTSHRPWESTSPDPNYDLCLELITIGQNQPFSIAEVLSFNQKDNELLATPREFVNLSINSGLNLAYKTMFFLDIFTLVLIIYPLVEFFFLLVKQGMSSFVDILLVLVFIEKS